MATKKEKADKKIRTYNQAVDRALAAGNEKAAEEFAESLHNARMERLTIKDDE